MNWYIKSIENTAPLSVPVIIDGRKLHDPKLLRMMGVAYEGVGR